MCNAKKLENLTLFDKKAADWGTSVRWKDGLIRNLEPRRLARPTNILPVMRPIDPADPAAGLEIVDMRWWMVPFFHKGPDLKSWKAMCTNARAEEIAGKSTFREPYKKRRGVALVDGFYEWTAKAPTPKPRWLIERADGEPMAFPIVWDTWRGPDGPVENYALLTTAAGPGMNGIHDRQPVILEDAQVLAWLDLANEPAASYAGSEAGALKLTHSGVGFEFPDGAPM
jgi:putative SOS response-associated peptidase YedK